MHPAEVCFLEQYINHRVLVGFFDKDNVIECKLTRIAKTIKDQNKEDIFLTFVALERVFSGSGENRFTKIVPLKQVRFIEKRDWLF
jgi:hypothetical protein